MSADYVVRCRNGHDVFHNPQCPSCQATADAVRGARMLFVIALMALIIIAGAIIVTYT